MAKHFRPNLSVCIASANPALLTHTLFDPTHRDSRKSPLSEFLKRLESINRLAPKPTEFNPFQAQLVLLGVVAAVESYLRTLFRRLIVVDSACQAAVHDEDVSFGAAMYLSKELLPEAILERVSFVNKHAIESTLRDLLAVKGNLPPAVATAIDDYARVCQLRHCAVHRFGKLGARNAIALGLTEHKDLMEKPLKLDYEALQNGIAIATGLVKALNNFLFNEILSRVPRDKWTGIYSKDRAFFLDIYNLFSDKVSPTPTSPPRTLYREFQAQYISWAGTATR